MVEVKYKSVFEMPFLFITIFSLLGFVVVPIYGMLKALWDIFNVGMDVESIKLFVLCATNHYRKLERKRDESVHPS